MMACSPVSSVSPLAFLLISLACGGSKYAVRTEGFSQAGENMLLKMPVRIEGEALMD